MADIDTFLLKKVNEITDDECKSIVVRCLNPIDYENVKFVGYFINSIYECAFIVKPIPYNKYESIAMEMEEKHMELRATLTDIENAKYHYNSDKDLDKFLHFNTLIKLALSTSTSQLAKEFYRVEYPLYTYRYSYKLNFYIKILDLFDTILHLNLNNSLNNNLVIWNNIELTAYEHFKNIIKEYEDSMMADKLFIILCNEFKWNIKDRIIEMIFIKLITTRYLLITNKLTKYQSLINSLIHPYIKKLYEEHSKIFSFAKIEKFIIESIQILNKDPSIYITTQIERFKNRENEPNISTIGDVIMYYIKNNMIDDLIELLHKNIDLVLRLRYSQLGCVFISKLIGYIKPHILHKDARFKLIETIKKLSFNYLVCNLQKSSDEPQHLADILPVNFDINIYLNKNKMNEECCMCFDTFNHMEDYIIKCKQCKCIIHKKCGINYMQINRTMRCPLCRVNGRIGDLTQFLNLDISINYNYIGDITKLKKINRGDADNMDADNDADNMDADNMDADNDADNMDADNDADNMDIDDDSVIMPAA
jgi:hypothetical protein